MKRNISIYDLSHRQGLIFLINVFIFTCFKMYSGVCFSTLVDHTFLIRFSPQDFWKCVVRQLIKQQTRAIPLAGAPFEILFDFSKFPFLPICYKLLPFFSVNSLHFVFLPLFSFLLFLACCFIPLCIVTKKKKILNLFMR